MVELFLVKFDCFVQLGHRPNLNFNSTVSTVANELDDLLCLVRIGGRVIVVRHDPYTTEVGTLIFGGFSDAFCLVKTTGNFVYPVAKC